MAEMEFISSKIKYRDGKRFTKKYREDGSPVWVLDRTYSEVKA
jgi:hypothetical protein